MESGTHQHSGPSLIQIDLRGIELPVLPANEQELAAHEEVLQQIDKASSGNTVWRKQPETVA
jgi:DNA polymerase-3 subunit epsilon